MFDIRQSKEWQKYLRTENWCIEEISASPKSVAAFIKNLPLTPFSVMKIQRFSGVIDKNSIDGLKKKHHIIYSSLEPSLDGIIPDGYHQSHSPYLPTKTIIIDLKLDGDKIFSDMSGNAKRILKKNAPVDIITVSPNDFYSSWRQSSKSWILPESSFHHLLSAFGSKAKLLGSVVNGSLTSGLLLLYSADTAYYYLTWTASTGRNLNAHYYLVWYSLNLAKKDKMSFYDFEGVYDARFPQERWRGFSEFKHKFGGQELCWPGSFSKWF